MRLAIAALLMTLMVGCGTAPTTHYESGPPKKDHRLELIEQDGVTDVVIGGFPLWGCSEDDDMLFSRTFTGAKNGKPISGYICGGLWKGYTIRYE